MKIKIIIVISVTCIAAIATYLVTISKPQLYAVNSSFFVQTLPIKTSMDINKHVVASLNDRNIVDSVSTVYNINRGIYASRVSASVDSRKCITLIVSSEKPEEAAGMSDLIITLLNKNLKDLIASQSQYNIQRIKYQMEDKIKNLDSLKAEISLIDSTISQKVSKSGTRKDILTEHKILLEENPEYIFKSKLIEKLANDYGAMISELAEIQNQIQNQNYITIISAPDSNMAYKKTNKTKKIFIVTFISFICSICAVSFIGMVRQRKSNSASK